MEDETKMKDLLKTFPENLSDGTMEYLKLQLYIVKDKVRVVISSLAQDQLFRSGGQTRQLYHLGTA